MLVTGLVSVGRYQASDMNEKSTKEPGFEQALSELENLVEQMESGELSLDQSLEQFKRGVKLTRHCQSILDHAQQIVEQVIAADDEPSAVPFESKD